MSVLGERNPKIKGFCESLMQTGFGFVSDQLGWKEGKSSSWEMELWLELQDKGGNPV